MLCDRGRDCLGVFFKLSADEWCWIVLAIAIVWTAEALNTAFEFLADAASPNFIPRFAMRKMSRLVQY